MTINGQPPITEVLFACKYPGPWKKALFSGRSEVEVMLPHLAKKKKKNNEHEQPSTTEKQALSPQPCQPGRAEHRLWICRSLTAPFC